MPEKANPARQAGAQVPRARRKAQPLAYRIFALRCHAVATGVTAYAIVATPTAPRTTI
jgi:hypothetical protein